MAQHRVMTILLFVSLSLVFEVAQSKLLPLGGPCLNSTECETECCDRPSRQGYGQCKSKPRFPFGGCYGPNVDDRCYYSNECKSGCCHAAGIMQEGRCFRKYTGNRCVGPNNGDSCYLSEECKSGCCYSPSFVDFGECVPSEAGRECLGRNNGDRCVRSRECDSGCCRRIIFDEESDDRSECAPRSAEGQSCEDEPFFGSYEECPCADGLTCEGGSYYGICKMPNGK